MSPARNRERLLMVVAAVAVAFAALAWGAFAFLRTPPAPALPTLFTVPPPRAGPWPREATNETEG